MRGRPDYSPTAVDVVLRPEWEAYQALDKNFFGQDLNKDFGETTFVDYTVPAGKTLYITEFGCQCRAASKADADNNQICWGFIYDDTTSTFLWISGGSGGITMPFNKPLVIPATHQVSFQCFNGSNHLCDISVSAGGYEI
jgi:hypothetical protein